ncbi:MAG TPA: amino acid adenylation domain-containing protein [Chitinophaga sp.]|uniref:amino acid adenylation domain-containing protein n=1 Tax=Chitinophaga sp. TaxID=1869181 RepID=UPI002F95DB99
MNAIDKVHFLDPAYQPSQEFWSRKLAAGYGAFKFRQTNANTPGNDSRQAVQHFELSGELYNNLVARTGGNDTAAFVYLLAAFGILLKKYSGSNRVTIDSPLYTPGFKGKVQAPVTPLILEPVNELCLRDYLAAVKQTVKESYTFQNYPLELIYEQKEMRNSNVLIHWDAIHMPLTQHNNYDLVISIKRSATLHISLHYNTTAFEAGFMQRLTSHLANVLACFESMDAQLQDVELLDLDEKMKLVRDLNRTNKDYALLKTFQELFEAQVRKTPYATALVFEETALTYVQLNEKANQLAHYLLQQYQVKPDDIVGILAERSERLIIAILGILKAGAAFLPIDTSTPANRITHILQDANAKVLLTENNQLLHLQGYAGAQELLDSLLPALSGSKENPGLISKPCNLAYVIYTSGSTGLPKGVMLGLDNLSHYLLWANDYYFNNILGKTFALFTNISFDLTITCIFTTLLRGDTLFVCGNKDISDILLELFSGAAGVNTVKLTPSHISMLSYLPLESTPVQYAIVGGETLTAFQVSTLQRLNPAMDIYNEYGPTEITVGCTVKHVKDVATDLSTIGKPIANTQLYIMDENLELLPMGITGEICIGGAGVAKGYRGRPELTSEKFVKDPFGAEDDRLYRTGDLGRWNEDGEVEFLGRRDNQVKIRGYRIELGEIENALLQYETVKEAVVLVHEQENAVKSLVAYCTATAQLSIPALKEFLITRLPEYMIPAHIMCLDKFPVTNNGKVERSALPVPGTAASGKCYEAACNDCEAVLIAAFSKVLGVSNIGMQDDFFALGGDSIKAIQITSHLYEAGYRLEVRQVLRYPVIKKLAAQVTPLSQLANQGVITGELPLTPIQQQFFAFKRKAYDHFNFGLLFFSKERLEAATAATIFRKLQEHHDALRITFRLDGGTVTQYNHGLDYPFSIEEYEYTEVQQLENKLRAMQAQINLGEGPLLKIALFHLPDGDRLAMIVHHLVTDVVSLRILFEDMGTLYRQHLQAQPFSLPRKTDAFKVWAEKLQAYANSAAFLLERAYWQKILAVNTPVLQPDFPQGSNLVKDRATKQISLEADATHLLLTAVHNRFHTEINDLLLTALALGLRQSFGWEQCRVLMEGHGREDILDQVNVSRTVGYFTTVYPVILTAAGNDLSTLIKRNKKRLHAIPHKGIGYGILKYLTAAEHKQELDFSAPEQIAFNYFGQFDQDLAHLPFGFAKEDTGPLQDTREQREYELYITAMTEGGLFTLTIDYSVKRFAADTIQGLLENYQAALNGIIEHCAATVTA